MARPKDKPKMIQRPRGTHDVLPPEQPIWEAVRKTIRELSRFYGFERIETPHFEMTDLFTTGVGEATDIVTKQMYSFKTRGGDQLTLRPEGTAPVARAFIEHGMMNWPQPIKVFYDGSFFRHENPQRGRYREFHQWGLEVLGDDGAVADAEVIHVFTLFLREWGFKDFIVEVNSIGCPACRAPFRAQLTQYYRSKVRGLCKDCKERFKENPLRLLDCTEEKCMQVKKGAPQLLDKLCEACRSHFKLLLEFLEELQIPYALNPHLVRGLDYYTRTVFEAYVDEPIKPSAEPISPEAVVPEEKSADEEAPAPVEAPKLEDKSPRRLAVFGGGRYDNLVELVGGKSTPACGGALGLERFIALVREAGRAPAEEKPNVFLVQLGELARKKSFRIMEELRAAGITMAESLGRDSIRSQLKVGDRVGALYALIIGQKEALDEMVILREMSSGIQETIPRSRLVDTLKRKLKT
ncbi:histidine--tRNA ligase [Candidatus Parcubacteria bacterium]|nr:MAG: histidine--tRNA ligase [Candidatus Parcubacteria bacterium]